MGGCNNVIAGLQGFAMVWVQETDGWKACSEGYGEQVKSREGCERGAEPRL